jgi:hypothetical protein
MRQIKNIHVYYHILVCCVAYGFYFVTLIITLKSLYDIVKYACCFIVSVTCSISGESCDLVYDDWNEK